MKTYNKAVVWGTWDFCHEGHLNLISRAYKLAEEVVVGVSTDDMVFIRKGKFPTFNYEHRSRLIGLLKFVSAVYPQSEGFSKKDLIMKVKPDVVFVGHDYKKSKEYEELKKLGVKVVYLPRTPKISSTIINENINNNNNSQ